MVTSRKDQGVLTGDKEFAFSGKGTVFEGRPMQFPARQS